METTGTPLVVQWVGIHLPMLGTQVQSLVWEDSTCLGQLKPKCSRALKSPLMSPCTTSTEACAPQQEKPLQWEAQAPQQRVAPTHTTRQSPCSNNDPGPPKK